MATVQVPQEVLREWAQALSAVRAQVPPPMAQQVASIVTVLTAWASGQESAGTAPMEANPVPALTPATAAAPLEAAASALTAELSSVASAVADSVTPALVERVTALLTEFGVIGSRLASPAGLGLVESVADQAQELTQLLRQMSVWQANGTWALVENTAALVKALQDSVSPALAERVIDFLVPVVGSLSQMDSAGMLEAAVRLAEAAPDSLAHAREDRRRLTVVALLREVQNPEVQLGIKTLLQMLRRLPYAIEG